MSRKINFEEMALRLQNQPSRIRVAVAAPSDSHTEEVVMRSLAEQIADFVLVITPRGRELADRIASAFGPRIEVRTATDDREAAEESVAVVRSGYADVLMKGSLNTDVLLRAVLDKERGLLVPGAVLSHVAAAQIPSYSKMLLFSDAAVIPRPTVEQFDAIVRYCVNLFRILGDGTPHVALTHCTEKTSDKFPHTLSYAELRRRALEGCYGDAVVDGPMDVKTACDAESGDIKGITSPVAGNADILIFPNIEAGNTFYKPITLFAGATTAGMLCGTTAPVVVASRADSAESKFRSLVMACAVASAVKDNASEPGQTL